ncbi:unnamed protein product, partial [Staurois parvus]
GFGPWSQGGNLQGGPYVEHGGHWQGYEYHEPMMDMDGPGPSFSQGFGMPPDFPPIPKRPPFHLEFELSEGANHGFDRNAGWQSEIGSPFWDRAGGSRQGFRRPFDRSNARGVDDHVSKKKKRKRIFSAVQPAPVKFDKKSVEFTQTQQKQTVQGSQPSEAQVKDAKQHNGNAKQGEDTKLKSIQEAKGDKSKMTKNEGANTKVAPGKMEPTDGKSVSDTSSTTFTCRLCKYETQDETEVQKHFISKQHLEVIRHLYIFLPKQSVDFLQRYLNFEKNKVSQERKRENLQAKRDVFEGIGQEHFFHRIEAAHCLACDTLIPDVPELLIEHTKSESHTQKCKTSSKEIKSNCLAMAKAMLQDENVLRTLKVYNKGWNPSKDRDSVQASSHDVLVAEEDDYVPTVEDVCDADGDKNIDFMQNMKDSTTIIENSSLNALLLSQSEVMDSNGSDNENVLIIPDIDETDEEEAAEAP